MTLEILPVPVEGGIRPGDDLAGAVLATAPSLVDGDVLVVSHKAVAKADNNSPARRTDNVRHRVAPVSKCPRAAGCPMLVVFLRVGHRKVLAPASRPTTHSNSAAKHCSG